MKRFTALLATLGLSLLTACASEPFQDRYYSLVLAADDVPAQTTINTSGAKLSVGPVGMARYLTQSGLATQQGDQQIQIANHSFWAEPLDEGIAKVLVRDISIGDASLQVGRESGRWVGKGDCQLRLEFDKFQMTDNSSVVARGRYWLTAQRTGVNLQSEFDLSQKLKSDGYANAVNQLRALLGELSGEIVAAIAQHKVCEAASPVQPNDSKPIVAAAHS